jgi:hypothetical protein
VHGLDAAGYQRAFDNAAAAGFHPIILSAAGPRSAPVFAGVFEQFRVRRRRLKPGELSLRIRNSSSVSVLLNRGDGTFMAKLDYPTSRRSPQAVAISDLNGDGKPDLVTANDRTVSVLINTPGLCDVQDVKGMTLADARATLARLNCRVGTVGRIYSKGAEGSVLSQKPGLGAVLPGGGKVNLVVSLGPKR